MIEVVPSQAATDKLLGELSQIIINLEPVFVQNQRLYIRHQCQLSVSNFLKTIALTSDNIEPVIIKSSKVINEEQRTHEVSLIHVKRACQNINIEVSIKLGIHKDDLSILGSSIKNTSGIILTTHKRKKIALTPESLGIVIHITTVNANRLKFTARNALNDKILEQQELIIVSASIYLIDNISNKISYTIIGQKSSFKLFLTNRNRIKNFPVHNMESALDIRLILFQFSCFGFLRAEHESLGNTDKNILNSLAVVDHTLLESLIRVIKGSRLDSNNSDSINKSVNKLIRHSRSTIKHFTYTGNIISSLNLRNLILICK